MNEKIDRVIVNTNNFYATIKDINDLLKVYGLKIIFDGHSPIPYEILKVEIMNE